MLKLVSLLTLAVSLSGTGIGTAQTAATSTSTVLKTTTTTDPVAVPTAYDVVAIKPNKSGSGSMRISTRDANYLGTNVSLLQLLANAYGIRDGLITGLPGWAESARFDINAKIVDPDPAAVKNLTRDQRGALMIALLTDRFGLKAHKEIKTLPIYELVIAKERPRFKEVAPAPPQDPAVPRTPNSPGSMTTSRTELTGNAIPIASLISSLSNQLDRNVIDKTGLAGKYNLHLKWAPDQPASDSAASAEEPAPPLFTAIQEQLGLKLQPAKGPVEALVVDHVEQPTEN
jgi:uncharacterized protein (TIGR03435 family)